MPCPLKHMRTLIHTFAFEEELDKIDIIIVSNPLLKEELLMNEQQKLLNKDEYIYVYEYDLNKKETYVYLFNQLDLPVPDKLK